MESQADAVAGAEVADADAEGGGLGEQRAVGCGVGIDGDPELAGTEVAQDGGHSSHVVGVGVGEGDDVEAAELARPEVGRDDLFADVEGGRRSRAAFSALAAAPVGPPASMSMARPVGPTTSSESPWPTSMAVTSSWLGWTAGGTGQRTIAAARGRTATAAHAIARERRTAQQQKAKQATASRACGERGAGDAEVGGLRVADAVDGAGDAVQQKRQRGAGQSGEPRD